MGRTGTIITELISALKGIKKPTYPITVADVNAYAVNILQNDVVLFPQISIIDNGAEVKRVDKDYNSFTRFDWDVLIRGCVKSDTADDIYVDLSNLEAAVKQLIDSAPSISNVLQWKFTETIDRLYETNDDEFLGMFVLKTRIIYTAGSAAF